MSTAKGKASNKVESKYQKFEDEEQKPAEKKISSLPGIFFYSFLSFLLKIYFLKKKKEEKKVDDDDIPPKFDLCERHHVIFLLNF